MNNSTVEVPHFEGFKNIEEGYYTKNVLNKEYGVKPINEKLPDATARVYMRDSWRYISLYHLDNCIEIKRRKVIEHELTMNNIAQSLYLINKSAKISRDTKRLNYENRNHSVVKSAKTRQNKLYDLKETVLNKLMQNNDIEVVGYHLIKEDKYLLLKLEGFTYHKPTYSVEGLKELGTINEDISAEKTRDTTLNFHEAVSVLERYVQD